MMKLKKSCMSPEEAQIQRALGLLNDWIVSITDRKELLRLGSSSCMRESRIIIVVEAVSREDALKQVKQADILPREDFMYPCSWESNVYGAYCRKHCHEKRRYGERIYVL